MSLTAEQHKEAPMPDDAPTRIEYHSHPDKDGICIFTLFYPDESAEDGEFVEVQLEDPRGFGFDLPTAEQVTP